MDQPDFLRTSDLREDDGSYLGCSQITASVPSWVIPPSSFDDSSAAELPLSAVGAGVQFPVEPYTGSDWFRSAASSSFGCPPAIDLFTSAVDAGFQNPASNQSLQQHFLPWPQPIPTTELQSSLIPFSGYESLSNFEQAPRQRSRRCVRCWALRKPVSS
jgi:hypothetical protein